MLTVVEEKTTYGLPHEDLFRLVGLCSHIDVVGFDTDACVMAAAVNLFDAGYDFDVLGEYCASTNGPDYHEAGMKIINKVLARQPEPDSAQSRRSARCSLASRELLGQRSSPSPDENELTPAAKRGRRHMIQRSGLIAKAVLGMFLARAILVVLFAETVFKQRKLRLQYQLQRHNAVHHTLDRFVPLSICSGHTWLHTIF